MGGAHLRIHGPRSPSLCHAGCKGFSAKSTSVPFPHISATFEQDVSGASTSGLGDCSGKLGKGLPCVSEGEEGRSLWKALGRDSDSVLLGALWRRLQGGMKMRPA